MPDLLRHELGRRFPCCVDAMGDLKASCKFWAEVHRCVSTIAEPLGALDFKASMDLADSILKKKCKQYGIS